MRTGSVAGALGLMCVVSLSGCAASSFQRSGSSWRHANGEVTAPDLTREGWRRLRVDGAELAFQKNGEGIIAMRVSCGKRPRSLRSVGRDLWLGIPRRELALREIEVGGHPAVETSGLAGGAAVRAVVVSTDGCVLDVAHVRPESQPDSGALEQFLQGLRFGGTP